VVLVLGCLKRESASTERAESRWCWSSATQEFEKAHLQALQEFENASAGAVASGVGPKDWFNRSAVNPKYGFQR
jgi:hypothetical protein